MPKLSWILLTHYPNEWMFTLTKIWVHKSSTVLILTPIQVCIYVLAKSRKFEEWIDTASFKKFAFSSILLVFVDSTTFFLSDPLKLYELQLQYFEVHYYIYNCIVLQIIIFVHHYRNLLSLYNLCQWKIKNNWLEKNHELHEHKCKNN